MQLVTESFPSPSTRCLLTESGFSVRRVSEVSAADRHTDQACPNRVRHRKPPSLVRSQRPPRAVVVSRSLIQVGDPPQIKRQCGALYASKRRLQSRLTGSNGHPLSRCDETPDQKHTFRKQKLLASRSRGVHRGFRESTKVSGIVAGRDGY